MRRSTLFDSAAGTTVQGGPGNDAYNRRVAHGSLMAINFLLVLPLGALAARQLRSHWLTSPAIRASLFYVHIATQVRSGGGDERVAVRVDAAGMTGGG